MATTSRTRVSALGKEKKGTSPSINSQTSSDRSEDHKEKSSQTEKRIPNYLKPTISSRHEAPLKPLKKTTNDQDNQRFLRRRSFDRPPSASPRGQRPLHLGRATGTSPAPVVPREKKLIVRSASFSGKSSSVSTPRSVLDNRSSKTPKDVKSQVPVFSKTARKGLTASPNRKECNVINSSSRASSQDSTETFDHENYKQEEKERGKVDSDTEVNSYVTKSENEEESDAVDTERSKNGEVEKICPSDMSICTSEDQKVVQVGQNEETDTQREESTENLSNDQAESCNDSPEETVIEEVKMKTLTENEEKGEDEKNENENTTSGEEIGDEKKIVEEKDLQGEEEAGSEEVKGKEGQELEGDVDEGKQDREAENAAQSKTQGGKKESPTAYNDVIEETASKLLEKRKNKVKALVGAFETVIDHQSGGSK